ncbi:MAG: error-prone DNA polymerase [Alphaproteobacteria bacterium]|nr:error-prone DNA polymerase [Alphaproteobacteria bacterium]
MATSNYSFLCGASHPEELAGQAASLGHAAVAVADRNTLAGVVRLWRGAKDASIRPLTGARLDFADGHPSLLCYPVDRAAYGRLSRLLTVGRRRAPKGECRLHAADIAALGEDQVLIAVPPADDDAGFAAALGALAARRPGDAYLAAFPLYRGDDRRHIARLAALAAACGVPMVACNDVQYHHPSRRLLHDVVTCIRAGCTVAEAGYRLHANAERHLKPAAEMMALFADHPDAVARTAEVAARCRFSLKELSYEYPEAECAEGRTAAEELRRRTIEGARWRYPGGVPAKVRALVERELELIAELGFEAYFLTVHDIVRFARAQAILCQGRGSAANSAVCYCLGITAVDPDRIDVLFERFVSAARGEPPDIDVDFEHERREEVIQHIYRRYGRERAGLAATVICYRARGAIREVGKALGLSADTVAALASTVWGWSEDGLDETYVREAGIDPRDPTVSRAIALARALIGFPRHLSQHVGGFVMTRGRLDELVPVENAAMADRTVIQWDKDDLDALGILKVDVLGLGMLTCLRKGFALIQQHHGRRYELGTVPPEDRAVYDMLCKADSIGVFQVESRAQMSMLPRLKPRKFYDLVIEVAIVRPGPIQGDMVHPYLRRRDGRETVDYPSEELRQVLEKTLGVPLFQEQAMRIAIVAGGFTPSEADQLRRAMAAFRRSGTIGRFQEKLIEGMVANGYARDFAERCFRQIEGFGEYGFPESHAVSFALLVYVSAWMKRHYPAAFACALLNAQPMGFYAPAQIVRDAAEHGVAVLPVDVNRSDWDCTLEPSDCAGGMALRLGFRQARGLGEAEAKRVVAARGNFYGDPASVLRRAGVKPSTMDALARADAFGSMDLTRRPALWAARGLREALPLFAASRAEEQGDEPRVALPATSLGEEVVADYATLSLSLKRHPVALLRDALGRVRLDARVPIVPAGRLAATADGRRVAVAGLVLIRQRPGSAAGVIFMTLEDETGVANLVVWPDVMERHRRVVMGGRLVLALGRLQREGDVIHVVTERLAQRDDLLLKLAEAPDAAAPSPPVARPDHANHVLYPSRDFH